MNRLHLSLLAAIVAVTGFVWIGLATSSATSRDAEQTVTASGTPADGVAVLHSAKSTTRSPQSASSPLLTTRPTTPSLSGLGSGVAVIPPHGAGSPAVRPQGPNRQGPVPPVHRSAPKDGDLTEAAPQRDDDSAAQFAAPSASALAAQVRAFKADHNSARQQRLDELASHQPGCKCKAHLGTH